MNQRKMDGMDIWVNWLDGIPKVGSNWAFLQEPTCGRLVVQRWRPGYVDLKAAQGEADPDGSSSCVFDKCDPNGLPVLIKLLYPNVSPGIRMWVPIWHWSWRKISFSHQTVLGWTALDAGPSESFPCLQIQLPFLSKEVWRFNFRVTDGNGCAMAVIEQWISQSNGCHKAMDVMKQWMSQSNGCHRAMDVAKQWMS